MDRKLFPTLRRRLLRWFDANRRALPWRGDRDPYRIFVSEVMLQQTTVATVSSRFEPFLTAFPTVAALAAAEQQQVLHQWQGLGYYRRARDLHRAAKFLAEHHGGSIPDDPDVWEGLPGVGRYIMGAVLSQAFERRLPIVEANSQRVLCRLFGQRDDVTATHVRKWLWQTAEDLLPTKRIGDFNQALMELGAIVCTPRAPKCDDCPLAASCVARREGLQEILPTKGKVKNIEAVAEVAVVLRKGTKVLLAQRPPDGRWGGMWEFPHATAEPPETPEETARRVLAGIEADVGGEITTIRHSVTRFRITMVCLEAFHRSGQLAKDAYPNSRWLELSELSTLPISTPQRRLAECVRQSSRQLRLF